MKNTIHIAFSTDKNYIENTIVAMVSVLLNCNDKINFYILSSEFGQEEEKKFCAVKKIKDCNIFFKNINQEEYKKYFPNIDAHYSLPVYYRFLIPRLFPEIDKFLYLDGDLIVTTDVSKLFNTNLKKYPLAMCEDFNKHSFNARLNMKEKSIYYNAGVMLINCKIWREEQLADKLFDFALKHKETIVFPIQDALNPYMEGKILTLDKTWNSQVYQTEENQVIYNFNCKKDKTNIIHYIGKVKPWSVNAVKNRFFDIYFKYKQRIIE